MSAADVAAAVGAAEAWEPVDRDLANQPRNDIGNGQRLVKRFGESLRFVPNIGWHAFDGARWSSKLGDNRSRELAHRTALAIRSEAAWLQDEGPRKGESDKDFRDRVEGQRKWSTASGYKSRLDAMLNEAAPYVELQPEQLDADPFVLNVANGTLALRPDDGGDIVLRPHNEADHISRLAPVAYDPEAECPKFRAFLARILPDPESQVFVQRWFGYSLTGDASEQRVVVLFGSGANGKSTLLDVAHHVMGDYAIGLPIASLTADDRRRGDSATPDLARLPGARSVRSSEPKAGFRLDEAMVKTMTSGEPMTVRHLHQGFFEFSPTFKLTLSTNHKPIIRGTDVGIWRRLVLVPFDVEIPEAERDRSLAAKLREEAPGILNWMLDGCRLWREDGLAVPSSLKDATADYRADSDPLSGFLDAAVAPASPTARTTAKDLYEAYRAWCAANAVDPPITAQMFGRLLADRGFEKKRGHVVTYAGLMLVGDYATRGQGTMFPSEEGDAR